VYVYDDACAVVGGVVSATTDDQWRMVRPTRRRRHAVRACSRSPSRCSCCSFWRPCYWWCTQYASNTTTTSARRLSAHALTLWTRWDENDFANCRKPSSSDSNDHRTTRTTCSSAETIFMTVSFIMCIYMLAHMVIRLYAPAYLHWAIRHRIYTLFRKKTHFSKTISSRIMSIFTQKLQQMQIDKK